jgi:hypothetical protein
MDFSILCEILGEWKRRFTDIHEFENEKGYYYYNARRVIAQFRELSAFLRKHEPALRSWMMEYLEKHRNEIFVKWWSHHVSEWAKDQVDHFPCKQLHPNTQMEWDRVFGKEKSTCFSLAYTVVKEARERRMMRFCDDKTILAIHEGNKHTDNGFFCDLCDDQESLWANELIRRMEHSAHPLLNPSRSRWIGKFDLGDWSPPKLFGTIYEEGGKSHDCYDFEKYKQHMVRSFLEHSRGSTPIQATKYFLSHTVWHGWRIPYGNDFKNEYNAFLLLWNCIDRIEPTITMGLPILQDIEGML